MQLIMHNKMKPGKLKGNMCIRMVDTHTENHDWFQGVACFCWTVLAPINYRIMINHPPVLCHFIVNVLFFYMETSTLPAKTCQT